MGWNDCLGVAAVLTAGGGASCLGPALLAGLTAAQQVPAVSSVSHTAVYTPSPDIPTTIVNIPHPSVISAPLLKSLHSTAPAVLAAPAPTQPVAKVGGGQALAVGQALWDWSMGPASPPPPPSLTWFFSLFF